MTPQTVNAVNLPLQNALNFPAAILQKPYFDPGARRRRQLRRHRRDDRPRDQPQLRRRRQPVRRAGPARQLVDAAGSRALQGGRRSAGRAVRRLPAVPGPGDQRAPGAQREHRRPGRPGRRLRRLPPVAERQAGATIATSSSATPRAGATRRGRNRSACQVTTDGHAPDAYRAATVRNLDPWYAAFSVTPRSRRCSCRPTSASASGERADPVPG